MLSLFLALALDPGLLALQRGDARLAGIAYRLQTANVALCSDVVPLTGLSIHTLGQYDPATRPAAAATFALGDRPALAVVVPGSPAAKAGLAAGDTITAIDSVPTPRTTPRKADYAATAATETALEAALSRPPAELTTATRQVALTGTPGCASRVQLIPGTSFDAGADGDYVQISAAYLTFAQSDDELAVLVAHELAHNILKHRVRLDSVKAARGLFAGFGKSGAAWRATEYEADRLGIWLIARAGYSTAAAVPFWTRLGAKTGLGILSDGTHPRWKGRIARIAEAVAQVEAQRAANHPLVPPVQQSASQPQIRR